MIINVSDKSAARQQVLLKRCLKSARWNGVIIQTNESLNIIVVIKTNDQVPNRLSSQRGAENRPEMEATIYFKTLVTTYKNRRFHCHQFTLPSMWKTQYKRQNYRFYAILDFYSVVDQDYNIRGCDVLLSDSLLRTIRQSLLRPSTGLS